MFMDNICENYNNYNSSIGLKLSVEFEVFRAVGIEVMVC
jgi:hypothetical protein